MAIQRNYLDSFIDVPHERHFAVEGIERNLFLDGETLYAYSGDHGDALDLLAQVALGKAKDGDWLVFLDSDAFPLVPLSKILSLSADFIAVQRVEHLGNEQPHPSFCAVRAELYRKLNASWKNGGFEWVDESGRTVGDVGSGFIPALRDQSVEWQPLRKIASRELHPVFFALYGTKELGPLVYHHGAGSKRKHTAIEVYWEKKKPLLSRLKLLQYRLNIMVSPRMWHIGLSPLKIGFSRPRKLAGKVLLKQLAIDQNFWRALYPSRANQFAGSVRAWCRRNGKSLTGMVRF